MDFLNNQEVVNAILIIAAIIIVIGVVKISWVQDTIKDEVDDIFKKLHP